MYPTANTVYRTLLLWAGVLILAASGCASSTAQEVRRGRLIIAGGATKADNEAIYSRFMASLPADAAIGVLPTASGVPEESAASSVATLKRYAGSRRVSIIDITTKNPERASDPAFVKQIEQCQGLWFTGGDQSRIIATFRPSSGDTPAFAAAARILAKGGVIGGTSAGAAMMSDPMIIGGTSEDALSGKLRAEPGDAGFNIGRGMGFFTLGLTDQHFLRRGRLGRLVVALDRTGLKRGYGVEENCALEVDCSTGQMTALGPSAAVIVVERGGDQRTGSYQNIRISLLQQSDIVEGGSGTIRPHKSRVAMATRGQRSDQPLPEAWSAGAFAIAIRNLAAAPERSVTMKSRAFTVTLSADDRTRFFAEQGSPQSVTAVDVCLDVVPSTPE